MESNSLNSPSLNTGNSTTNPQSTNTSLSGTAESPQNSAGTNSINYDSSSNSIPLVPTQFTTSSPQSTEVSHHHINLTPFIPLLILILLAIGVSVFIQRGSKKALVKT